jgi:hypothetical protein
LPGSAATVCGIPCGPSKICNGLTQYCERIAGGPPPPPGQPPFESFECHPLPSACATNHTCACVFANGGPPDRVCTSEKDGKVSVFYPAP